MIDQAQHRTGNAARAEAGITADQHGPSANDNENGRDREPAASMPPAQNGRVPNLGWTLAARRERDVIVTSERL